MADQAKKNLPATKGRPITIAIRIALLSWTVAMGSLLFFMVFTIPSQKEIFVNNLASKANGLAVSLHDVAAGAAVNEDYSSVVNAAQTLLKGDPDLDFLVVMKNDGFALVIQQKAWRVMDLKDERWIRKIRQPSWGIERVPLFGRPVFHFAQPFDYSGIQWGWIHVGLSLEKYNHSVSVLYKRTAVLALVCVFFSLMGSIVYAGQIVRPILKLQSIVRQIAQGDFSVRADTKRKDELGSLASSVNTMTDALLQRNQILESVRFAAYHFLQGQTLEDTITDVLEKIGMAADISRVLIYKTLINSEGCRCAVKLHEWTARGVSQKRDNSQYEFLDFEKMGVAHWPEVLEENQILTRSLDNCTDIEQNVIDFQGVKSFIAIAVIAENSWWGAIVLEDWVKQRTWTVAETSSFRALADMLGAAIERQLFQKALIDAKNNLEEQVAIRTRELQDQVKVKEKALSDLSSAQSSLVEMSRAAGMAEVATGVLHNVGNVLNSVNVSATMIMDTLHNSKAGNITKVAKMLDRSPEDLADFLTLDEKGHHIPTYLTALGQVVSGEHDRLLSEAESLSGRIEHIKEIVAMQQNYGRVSGISETISPEQLMEDALMLNERALIRHDITIKKLYENIPCVTVDKHKVLQILLNLINNAKYACADNGRAEKVISLYIFKGQGNTVCMSVKDNGVGIQPENLTRIFQHGFTTRKSGHGFGLHSGALAAQELGGSLSVASDGAGMGAQFTLELPVIK